MFYKIIYYESIISTYDYIGLCMFIDYEFYMLFYYLF